jgi:hypothetical protein
MTHYKQKLELTDEAIAHSVSNSWGKDVMISDLYMALDANPPSKRHLVNAYKAEGYKPKEIAEMLEITVYDARYYISNPPKREYVNGYLLNKFDDDVLRKKEELKLRNTNVIFSANTNK